MQLLHEYSPTHKLFKTTVADFLVMPVKNWRYNRTPDKARCREIAVHLQSKPIETVFYLDYGCLWWGMMGWWRGFKNLLELVRTC